MVVTFMFMIATASKLTNHQTLASHFLHICANYFIWYIYRWVRQCFDTDGWAAERASGL